MLNKTNNYFKIKKFLFDKKKEKIIDYLKKFNPEKLNFLTVDINKLN